MPSDYKIQKDIADGCQFILIEYFHIQGFSGQKDICYCKTKEQAEYIKESFQRLNELYLENQTLRNKIFDMNVKFGIKK